MTQPPHDPFATDAASIVDVTLRATLAASGGDVALIVHQHPADCGCGYEGPVGLVTISHKRGMSNEGVNHLITAVGKLFES